METRKQVEVIKDVVIEDTMFGYPKVTQDKIKKTLGKLSDTDEIIGLEERKGWAEPGFGSMDDEKVWYNHWAFVIKNYRPETDDEYFERMKNIEKVKTDTEEREKIEYLRLKAKFEKS